jgi:hypothetical protein
MVSGSDVSVRGKPLLFRISRLAGQGKRFSVEMLAIFRGGANPAMPSKLTMARLAISSGLQEVIHGLSIKAFRGRDVGDAGTKKIPS